MKYNIPERVLKDISAFAKKYSINKVILFDREQEVTIQREVILILLYMAEILTLFIGILKKSTFSFKF